MGDLPVKICAVAQRGGLAMAQVHDDTAHEIIRLVGGRENINNASHCMTRLRFQLKDPSVVDYKAIEKLPPVVGTKFNSGQVQVVIGTDVADYYAPVAAHLELDPAVGYHDVAAEKKSPVALFMETVSGVFGPIVPAIAGAGMIRGLMNGLAAQNLLDSNSHTFQVLDMISGGVFTFLPFFVAASAARVFKTNVYLAMALAAAMQYPTMTSLAAAGEVSSLRLFGLIPVPVFNYAGNVIPIIMSVYLLSWIHRFVDARLPKALRTVFTPTISLFVAGIAAFALVGPLGIYIGRLLADGVRALFNISPILAGIIFGATRPITIFLGLHHAMTPIALQNFADQGWDMLMPMMFMANMAITGAAFACYFKVYNKQEKTVIASAAVSGLLGITEPALFGILSKYKRAFVAATIGSALASTFIASFGVRIYGYILSSIFSLPAYVGSYFTYAVLGILIAIGSSFLITWFLIPKEQADMDEAVNGYDPLTANL